MQEAKKENTKRNSANIYLIDVMFFKIKLEKDRAIKTSFKDQTGRPLIYFWKDPKNANVTSARYTEDLVGKPIFRYEKETKNIFNKLMDTFNTDPGLEDDLYHTEQYMECIQIKSLEKVDGDTDFKPEQEKVKNPANVSMFNIYIQTPLNPDFETFKEAIGVKPYKEKECWFNTITDWYKDTLMGEKRREKNRLTKESMLKLMNKTEEDFKRTGHQYRIWCRCLNTTVFK